MLHILQCFVCRGVVCKMALWVRQPFAVILLLMLPLARLGAYDMCISVVRSDTESRCASMKEQFSV
jgi:hypothetical protein